jgi:hypothetical protein
VALEKGPKSDCKAWKEGVHFPFYFSKNRTAAFSIPEAAVPL